MDLVKFLEKKDCFHKIRGILDHTSINYAKKTLHHAAPQPQQVQIYNKPRDQTF
jgi:hypothetical protein